jgi:hypothetical protein
MASPPLGRASPEPLGVAQGLWPDSPVGSGQRPETRRVTPHKNRRERTRANRSAGGGNRSKTERTRANRSTFTGLRTTSASVGAGTALLFGAGWQNSLRSTRRHPTCHPSRGRRVPLHCGRGGAPAADVAGDVGGPGTCAQKRVGSSGIRQREPAAVMQGGGSTLLGMTQNPTRAGPPSRPTRTSSSAGRT